MCELSQWVNLDSVPEDAKQSSRTRKSPPRKLNHNQLSGSKDELCSESSVSSATGRRLKFSPSSSITPTHHTSSGELIRRRITHPRHPVSRIDCLQILSRICCVNLLTCTLNSFTLKLCCRLLPSAGH